MGEGPVWETMNVVVPNCVVVRSGSRGQVAKRVHVNVVSARGDGGGQTADHNRGGRGDRGRVEVTVHHARVPGRVRQPDSVDTDVGAVTGGEFQVTLAAVTVPSESLSAVRLPVNEDALFQFAAIFTPAISVGAIGIGVNVVPPAPPAALGTPPTKSILKIRGPAAPPTPIPPVPRPPVPVPRSPCRRCPCPPSRCPPSRASHRFRAPARHAAGAHAPRPDQPSGPTNKSPGPRLPPLPATIPPVPEPRRHRCRPSSLPDPNPPPDPLVSRE